jgi:hypothetical protein
VSRVALIYGPQSPDNIGPAFQNSPYNIKDDILASEIQLIANIAVPYRFLNEKDKKSVFGLLKRSDVRYILVMAEPQTIADVYFAARLVSVQ